MTDDKQTVREAFDRVISYSRSHVGSFEPMDSYKQNEKDAITLKHYLLNSTDTAALIKKLKGMRIVSSVTNCVKSYNTAINTIIKELEN